LRKFLLYQVIEGKQDILFENKLMEILHVISSIDLNSGGPSKSVSDLALNQTLQGHNVTIFSKSSPIPYLKDSPHPNLKLIFVIDKYFKKGLKNLISNHRFDILHGHGIWQMPVHNMANLGRKFSIPFLISPRGMLEPWALNQGKWKKKLALVLYQRRDLKNSASIHATAVMEAVNIRNLGFTNPIAVIPNGIDLSDFPNSKRPIFKTKRSILFLSRIHPKKGIELLIQAWRKLNKELRKDWEIIIAGNGEDEYVSSLEKTVKELGLSEDIKIIGPQFGECKLRSYQSADLFVLPTYSENFGIVVAEAMACGVPVITTKGTPWEELNTQNAGWWIDIGTDPLVKSLESALALSDSERQNMGKNGRRLIEEKYSIQAIALQMLDLYKWLIHNGDKPKFVFDL